MAVDQWRIAYDRLWAKNASSPSFLDVRFHSFDLEELQKGKVESGLENGAFESRFTESFIRGDSPVRDLGFFGIFARFPLKAYYDLLPLSKTEASLFLLKNIDAYFETDRSGRQSFKGNYTKEKWSFGIAKYEAKWGPLPGRKDKRGWLDGTWTHEEFIEVAFKEPFHVFAHATNYFFVTECGKLFMAPKSDKGPRKLQLIWDDDKRPISHMITDVDHNKTYAFGFWSKTDENKERLFYFPLTDDRPKPQIIDKATLKAVKADEPLRTVWQFALLLRDKELKGKLPLDAK